jgi:NADPH:quinone reductase-like Zn-dependent oxidoreductase
MNSRTEKNRAPRRVVIARSGSYDRLRFEEFAVKKPGPTEVSIAVEAIGVNYADCMVRMGLYQSAKDFVGWPITPGFEVAGVITAIGDDVQDLDIGARVFAVTLFDGYATRVTVKRAYVFPIPAAMTTTQAAGFPAVFLTAWFAMFELAHPKPEAKVLVHSAAGGVGSSLVQLARLSGCEVTGVVGASHKMESLTNLRVDHAIDKSRENLWQRAESIAPEGYDIIFDANGVATLKDSYAHLRRAGKLVVYGFHTMIPRRGGRPRWGKLIVDYLRTPRFNPLEMTTQSRSVLAFNLSYLFDRTAFLSEAMTQLGGWLETGAIKPPAVTTYAFDDVADAHRDLESAQTVGKLVLIP